MPNKRIFFGSFQGGGMRILQLFSIALVALSFGIAFYAYPLMPSTLASHWDISGNVNGHMGRDAGVFFMPVMALFLLFLFFALPIVDPMKRNYALFQKEYDGIMAMVIGFIYYVYLLTLAYNLGSRFNLMQALSPAFALLFFYMGVAISRAKQNWFVGIRTPWTLSSERVWDKTHQMGSSMFKAAGIVALLGIVRPELFLLSIAVVLAAAIATVVYSYVEFQKELTEKGGNKKARKRQNRRK
jgi:uncharacterized membrane protein